MTGKPFYKNIINTFTIFLSCDIFVIFQCTHIRINVRKVLDNVLIIIYDLVNEQMFKKEIKYG